MMTTAIKKAQQHDNQLTSIHSDLLQVFPQGDQDMIVAKNRNFLSK